MNILEKKILDEGTLLDGKILKVDNFLNHQLDIKLFNEMGREFKKRFQKKEVTKILTIESSGIAIACIAAQYFNVPVVFAKKHAGSNMDEEVFESTVYSFTKQNEYKIKVSKKYVKKEDKVLIIDDFLASGSAVKGLIEIVQQAGAEVSGVGIAIEKHYQGGRKLVEDKNIQLESLAILGDMKDGKIKFIK